MTTKKAAQLHEILAVETDVTGIAAKVLTEGTHTFKEKHNLFGGATKTLKFFDDTYVGGTAEATAKAEKAEEVITVIATTVGDKLKYVTDAVERQYDVVLQKEATNQLAKADIEVDGRVIASDVPVGFLLGLETKLKTVRELYAAIPTLAPNIEWVPAPDIGKGVWKTKNPTIRTKTAETTKVVVLAPATDKHPAQVKEAKESVAIGAFESTTTVSALTVSQKSELLARVDQLIQAVKQARQRANTQEVVKKNIGADLFAFINGSVFA